MTKTMRIIGAVFALGLAAPALAIPIVLPNDGTPVSRQGTINAGQLVFFEFALVGDVNNGDGTYLNIQTFGVDGQPTVDTEIGLYDSLGNFIVSDDDDNGDDPLTLLYSLLTFGDSDPLGNTVDSIAGQDGLLLAGMYTVVLGGFNTIFGATLNDITAGSSSGYTAIQWQSVTNVPEPGTLALLGIGLLGMGAARRRKV